MNKRRQARPALHSHTIRFPEEMYQELGELADRERRTFNWQVIYLIQVGLETIASQKGKAQSPPSSS